MADDGFDERRRWQRREYSRRHAKARRAADRDQGARRIDVTLKNEMREDYETVRDWLEGINRRNIAERRLSAPLHRLSDTEVIKTALRLAATHIRDEEKAGKAAGATRPSEKAIDG